MKRKFTGAALVTIGFILSPLSWWNDLVINVPLAYLFSYPFSLLDEQLFLPGFILGYWLSNLLGFLMLHWGGKRLLQPNPNTISIRRSLVISMIYSIIVITLVLLNWLSPPTEMLEQFKQGVTHA
ncbi:MAG: hypothetical protein OEY89_02370 [Gammaproteobacteria bacterium]|nr:hypothetical protein [Gammaproteobacteria bacterium]